MNTEFIINAFFDLLLWLLIPVKKIVQIYDGLWREEGQNEERPKIVRRENAVEVKIPREHVILGDMPEHVHVSGNVPFYRS